ncbi:regulatory protein RecX [Flavobacterium sp.]|uniref:regulatory protein RecX n=1 Tax=Flavobacterium sp. TaxID=239 RepID=UPI00286F89FC|nr:regulatory protein RecX [Flavobacterium sp.]
MSEVNSVKEAIHKIEHFCAYQERCHDEVVQKLRTMKMDSNEIDEILAHLIQENYLNESRFACSFARGKHRIKFWGKVRIVNELKFRNISTYNINLALKEITAEEYDTNFNALAERNWHSIKESNGLKKRKKCCDFLLRKGYENNLVYEKVKELEAGKN